MQNAIKTSDKIRLPGTLGALPGAGRGIIGDVFGRLFLYAILAQLVEQLPCKQQVSGSNPEGGSGHIVANPECSGSVLTVPNADIRRSAATIKRDSGFTFCI